jgi:hypothetical protein
VGRVLQANDTVPAVWSQYGSNHYPLALALPPFCTTSALAQVPQVANWVQIATEGQSITSTGTQTLQVCGDSQHCSSPTPNSSWPLVISLVSGETPPPPIWGPEPQSGAPKVIGALQTGSAQSFVVNGANVPVAALAPPPPTYRSADSSRPPTTPLTARTDHPIELFRGKANLPDSVNVGRLSVASVGATILATTFPPRFRHLLTIISPRFTSRFFASSRLPTAEDPR